MIHDPEIDLQPRYNIAPTQDVPVVIPGGSNRAVMMRWGFVPFWAKDPKIGNKLINARGEALSTSPAFRASARKRRCLVPATDFYEWKKVGSRKVPHYCHLKGDDFFAFAGLYDRWKYPDGTYLKSFTIVTTSPHALISKLHNRMPVILRREEEGRWIAPEPLEASEMTNILTPYQAKEMETYEVPSGVGNPDNESEDFVRPLGPSSRVA